jgi:NAD(P)H-quinone oxidoreductase subunit 5
MSRDPELVARAIGLVIVLPPLLALVATAVIAVFEAPVNERMTNRLTQASIVAALLGATGMALFLVASGRHGISVEFGDWVRLPEHHFRFTFKFLFDGLSVAFLLLSLVLSGVVGAFARVYLHREPGYRRFYLLFTVFVLGMSVSAIAGNIETLFAGWELVGLSSALLVGFFQERPSPVRNGLRVWAVYRIADAAFLAAAVALHHVAAEGDFVRMTGARPWPEGVAQVGALEALAVGTLLVVAAAGKSGLVPFSGWLPRAMEGPTPSSAIFYGALSVHLGAFLLLRVAPLIERSLPLCVLLVALGLSTAAWASVVARTQADIKSVLAFASLTQVGLIVAEIGLGLRWVALAHMVGNASLRTLQLLRAPSLLHDQHRMENAIGTHLAHGRAEDGRLNRRLGGLRTALYRLGYERSLFDIYLGRLVVAPFLRLLQACEGLERRWTRWLSAEARGEAHEPALHVDGLEPGR